ncbi:MAG: hypothetical protein HY689_00930 [Chloroflexi bacterium]|nr:hypothetical protein [Chloroflexota bacterium]
MFRSPLAQSLARHLTRRRTLLVALAVLALASYGFRNAPPASTGERPPTTKALVSNGISAPHSGGNGASGAESAAPAESAGAGHTTPESATSEATPLTTQPSHLRIVSLTNPVRPGSEASLTAETDPGLECQIGVYYRNGRSAAPELTRKAADATGLVSWRWRVEETADIDAEESSVLVLCSAGRDLLSRGAPLIPATD